MKKFLFFALFAAAIACTQTACQTQNQPEQPNEPEQPDYKYYLYDEPNLEWGASKSYVKKWMADKGYSVVSEENQDGYICTIYNGKYEEEFVLLMFDAQTSKYTNALVYIKYTNTANLNAYLFERYNIYSDGDFYYYLTNDQKTIIFIDWQDISDMMYGVVSYSQY